MFIIVAPGEALDAVTYKLSKLCEFEDVSESAHVTKRLICAASRPFVEKLVPRPCCGMRGVGFTGSGRSECPTKDSNRHTSLCEHNNYSCFDECTNQGSDTIIRGRKSVLHKPRTTQFASRVHQSSFPPNSRKY